MAARSTPSEFVVSQRFYLPETNLIQYRNTLATLFGLNEQQVSISVANDNLGNVYRQIILEKEAYARFLKQLIAPTKPITQADEALINQQYFDSLKTFNENVNFVSEQIVLREELLLMFAHFFRLHEIRQDALIQRLMEVELKEQKQLMSQARLSPETASTESTESSAADQIAALEHDFIKKINKINSQIDSTKLKLHEISINKTQLKRAIQLQTRRVDELKDQMQNHEHRIADTQSQIDFAIQRHMRIVRLIDERKESKRKEEQKLDVLKEQKILAQAKVAEFQNEIQSHADIAAEKELALEALSAQLHNPNLSDAQRAQLSAAYYEAETENFIHSMSAIYRYEDNDNFEDVVKQLSKKESVLEEHIQVLKREIKDLKKQMFDTETLIKDLNAKKLLLVEEYKKLSATHKKEDARLQEMIAEFKHLELKEELLYNNMEDLNKLKSYHETELLLSSTLIAIAEKKPALLSVLNTSKQAHTKAMQAIESMEMAIAKHTQTVSQKQQLLNNEQPGTKAYKKLQLELDKAQQSLTRMREKLQHQQSKADALKSNVMDAQNEVEQAELTHETIMHRLEKIKQKIHTLNSDIQRNQQQVERMEAQPKTMRPSVDYRNHPTLYTTNAPRPESSTKSQENLLRAPTLKPRKT